MDAASVSRALTPLPGHERYVRRGFWRKVLRTLGRVPFIDQAIAAYYAAIDPATPRFAKGMLMAALAYFIMPADMIPDVLAGARLHRRRHGADHGGEDAGAAHQAKP